MARKLETTLWQLVKNDGKSRYVKVRKAANGRWSTGVDGEHGSYYLRYTLNGQRKWESVGSDLNMAVTEMRARQALVTNGNGASPVPTRKTIAAAIQAYLQEVHTLRGQRSMERDKWLLDLFAAVIKKTYMDEITRDALFFFMAYLKNEGRSPKTIRCRLSSIETFRKKQGFPKLLLQGDLPRVTKKLAKDCYTEEEVNRMLAAAEPDERFLLQFLLVTGAREQEAAHTNWEDLDFTRNELRVTAKPEWNWTLKDFEERIVSEMPEWFMVEAKARKGTGLIFSNREGRPEGHILNTIQRIAFRAELNCGKCVTRAGESCKEHPVCRRYGTHKWRRTFATWHHVLGGVSAAVIQRWLGHSDLETTMRYITTTEIRPGYTKSLTRKTWSEFGGESQLVKVA